MTRFVKAASILALGISSVSGFVVTNGAASRATRTAAIVRNASTGQKLPILCDEEVMSQKGHGTSEKPVMKDLKWNCDYDTADRVCNFNRHYAEHAGYWQTTDFLEQVSKTEPTKYYDAVTGYHLFTAPVGRTMEAFLQESLSHGWPSFRDDEVNWEYVRCLENGECVSTTGTHLGHNLPDRTGNRYCINLVCVAGQPAEGQE